MPFFSIQHKRVFYDITGEGSQTILLLPGNTAASPSYAGDVERLGSRYRVVLIDFLGTGQSDRYAPGQYPGASFWHAGAEQASALLRHLHLAGMIAMGTSGGGVIALLLAALHPNLVQAVVADSCVDRWQPDGLRRMVQGRQAMMVEEQAFWRAMHGADWRNVIAMDNHALLALADQGGTMLTEPELSAVRCPVLLTGSAADDLIPHLAQAQTRMAGSLPDCLHHLAAAGTHPWMWSRADDFYTVLQTQFLPKFPPE
jgi:pimeloyl-ACP methyl ester carboxylesterase